MQDRHLLKQSLEQVQAPRILVIGDIMLDRYSWGSVERISPEAPVPILKVERENQRLGGAANVMTNLATLEAQVTACGLIGPDAAGQDVLQLLKDLKIEASGVFVSKSSPTILKHRLISGHNHLLRMDFDPPTERIIPEKDPIRLFLQARIPNIDLIVVSDYGKGLLDVGMLNTLAQLGQRHQVPVIVDPYPGTDYSRYRNFTLIKPNRKETEQAVGFKLTSKDSILKAAQQLKEQIKLKYVLISLDREGLLLFENAEHFTFFDADSVEVFDVVGAGDMVVSVTAVMMASNAPIEHAVYWANLAASMEILHVGVVSFTKQELLHRFEFGYRSSKIVRLESLLSELRTISRPIVFTNGYFDNISAGHLKFLQQLRELKGFNIVAINSDKSIAAQKGHAPLLNEQERASLLASLESVDRVLIFDAPNTNELIQKIQPSLVVKGERFRKQTLREQAVIEKVGARLVFLPEY
ncbi:PfkB family carbohydrate kinase [Deltaproteobacteria bacterium TL4]